tara:strand:- start:3898 stop:4479 length:582 start_codon:yes stop_codon:yes gene_type:complete
MHDQLPKIFCFISDYKENYIKRLPKNIAIIYRNYKKNIKKEEIIKIKNLCRKNKRKFFLANNFKTAFKLNLDGVYIPSFNKSLRINYFQKKNNFLILGSAHNILEIRQKEKQRVNCIFLSPVFITQKSKNFLGIQKFNYLTNYTKKKVICLGGIKQNNLNKIKLLNTYGFSSVSLFKQNIKYIKLYNEKSFRF